jgi:hypothetical protein
MYKVHVPESGIYNFLDLRRTKSNGTFFSRIRTDTFRSGNGMHISLNKVEIKCCICLGHRQRHFSESVFDSQTRIVDFGARIMLQLGSLCRRPSIHWPTNHLVAQMTHKSLA